MENLIPAVGREIDLANPERIADAVLERVGHELRTPLTVAMLACDMLKAQLVVPERRALAERAEKSVKRLHDRIEEILAFAAAARIPQVFATDLRELFTRINWECRELREERQVRLLVEGGEPLHAACDPVGMSAACKAIVLNALRASPRGGTVRVEFEASTAFAAVRVCDRGPGIPAELRERIFESFFQGEDPLTRANGGLGLGLSTAVAVVRAHGGSLAALPREGGGTVVRIQLPRRG